MSTRDPLPTRVRFLDSVRVRLGPERGFLFDQRSGRVYSLNRTAAVAVGRIQAGTSTAAVIEDVVAAFDVDAATVRRDLQRFVEHLLAEGLAETEGVDGG
jgi:uncharacterized iron-regulated protein